MKVIRNRDFVKVRCGHCGSELGVYPGDIKYNYHFGHHSYLYYDCAACGRKNKITQNCLPAHWQSAINDLIIEAEGDFD